MWTVDNFMEFPLSLFMNIFVSEFEIVKTISQLRNNAEKVSIIAELSIPLREGTGRNSHWFESRTSIT